MANIRKFNASEVAYRMETARDKIQMADMFISRLEVLKKEFDWLREDIDKMIEDLDFYAFESGADLLDCYREMMEVVFDHAETP